MNETNKMMGRELGDRQQYATRLEQDIVDTVKTPKVLQLDSKLEALNNLLTRSLGNECYCTINDCRNERQK